MSNYEYVMRREFDEVSPNGNVFSGFWVLRTISGDYVGHSQYRNDLLDQYVVVEAIDHNGNLVYRLNRK